LSKAINDETLKQIGIIFQYLIALRDCFNMYDKKEDEIIYQTKDIINKAFYDSKILLHLLFPR